MKFEDFDNKNRKQKILISIYAACVIFLLIIIIVIREFSKSYIVYKSAPLLDSKLLKRDICYQGFFSIVKKSALEGLVESTYIRALENLEYAMIDFEISAENIRKIEVFNENTCKIILKDENIKGHGLRSFQILLKNNVDFQFDYKISNIAEIVLSQEDVL